VARIKLALNCLSGHSLDVLLLDSGLWMRATGQRNWRMAFLVMFFPENRDGCFCGIRVMLSFARHCDTNSCWGVPHHNAVDATAGSVWAVRDLIDCGVHILNRLAAPRAALASTYGAALFCLSRHSLESCATLGPSAVISA